MTLENNKIKNLVTFDPVLRAKMEFRNELIKLIIEKEVIDLSTPPDIETRAKGIVRLANAIIKEMELPNQPDIKIVVPIEEIQPNNKLSNDIVYSSDDIPFSRIARDDHTWLYSAVCQSDFINPTCLNFGLLGKDLKEAELLAERTGWIKTKKCTTDSPPGFTPKPVWICPNCL